MITLWIIWFLGRQRDIDQALSRFRGTDVPIVESTSIEILVIGIIGLVMLLLGSVLLFLWGQRQSSFVRQQRSFVSSVTHELRTPLASIQLAHETLINRNLSEATQKQLVHMGLVDVRRLMRLVNQILISSRLDRGLAMLQDDVQVIYITQHLNEIVKSLSHLDQNPSRVHINCPEDLAFRMSGNTFNLVLGNLIENAFKYSPANTPIKISVHPEGGLILFSITDEGFGVERGEKRKIFKMFHRGAKASSNAIPGTGLGLFIVKTSLSQLGGRIKVESSGKGQGSTFHVWLPAN